MFLWDTSLSIYKQNVINHAIKMAEQITLLALTEVTANMYVYFL